MNQVDILSNDYFDLKAITQMTCAHLRRMTRKHLIGRDRRIKYCQKEQTLHLSMKLLL